MKNLFFALLNQYVYTDVGINAFLGLTNIAGLIVLHERRMLKEKNNSVSVWYKTLLDVFFKVGIAFAIALIAKWEKPEWGAQLFISFYFVKQFINMIIQQVKDKEKATFTGITFFAFLLLPYEFNLDGLIRFILGWFFIVIALYCKQIKLRHMMEYGLLFTEKSILWIISSIWINNSFDLFRYVFFCYTGLVFIHFFIMHASLVITDEDADEYWWHFHQINPDTFTHHN